MNTYDVDCPYCGRGQDIDHDDGYGYEEDQIYRQQCRECDNYFTYTTSIIYFHKAKKADCLNGHPHPFKRTRTFPARCAKMACETCDEERSLTEEEKIAWGFAKCPTCGRTPCCKSDIYLEPTNEDKQINRCLAENL